MRANCSSSAVNATSGKHTESSDSKRADSVRLALRVGRKYTKGYLKEYDALPKTVARKAAHDAKRREEIKKEHGVCRSVLRKRAGCHSEVIRAAANMAVKQVLRG